MINSIGSLFENKMDSSTPETFKDVSECKISSENFTEDNFDSILDNLDTEERALNSQNDLKTEDFNENANCSIEIAEQEKASKINIAFSGTAFENEQFGCGGGSQIFIPHSKELKENGNLNEISSEEFLFSSGSTECLGDQDSLRSKLDSLQSDSWNNHGQLNGYNLDVSSFESDDDYLDFSTPPNEMLTPVSDKQQEEDRLHPLSDQEDSGGLYFPDAWAPAKFSDGNYIVQVRSVEKEYDSPYYTDINTVLSCWDDIFGLNLSDLFSKLQLSNASDGKYTLKVFRYTDENN